MAIEIRNAKITGVTLSTADHGWLSSFVHLDYGDSGQGFGGYGLYCPGKPFTSPSMQRNYTGHFIARCLEIAGVDEWNDLIGQTVRVKADWGKVHAIGHILKDEWFNPTEEFEKLRAAKEDVVVEA